jgi:outer membrane receptor protein involved in Fe transport
MLAACILALRPAIALAENIHFDIPAEPVPTALRTFSSQSHMQLLYSPDALTGLTSTSVNGDLDVRAALQQLLRNTGLEAAFSSDGAATIRVALAVNPVPLDIPAQDLAKALARFQLQTHVQVGFAAKLVRGKTSAPVSGRYAPAEALKLLLTGTGLEAVATRSATFALRSTSSVKSGADAASRADVDHSQSNSPSERVLIEGQRINTFEAGGNMDIARTIDDEQPYYIFDSETIENSGATNLEDFLKQHVTMDATYQTSSQVYGANSQGTTSSVNLRGLGTDETLILVDGRRMAGVSYQSNVEQPDINGIPLAAIDRVEILPSGSSAIYGAGAMGGVINIILKKNYSGGDLKYTFDNVTDGNAPMNSIDGSYGFSLEGGKTQVMIAAHYSDEDPLLLGDRANVVKRGISTILRNDPSFLYDGAVFYGGTTPNITSGDFDSNGNPIPLTLTNGAPLNASVTYICPGISPSTSRAALDSCLLANAGKQNLVLAPGLGEYGLQQPLGSTARVESAIATLRRPMTPWLEAFSEISIEVNDGHSQYDPISDSQWSVPSGAPENPFQQDVTVHFPSTASAPLESHSVNRSITVGFTATMPHQWTGELDYTLSENTYSNVYELTGTDALDGNLGVTPPVAGALATGAVNPFVDTGAYPINLNSYLAPNHYESSATLSDLAMRGTGPLFRLPWGSVNLTSGLEQRIEGYPTNTQYNNYPITTYADNYTVYFGQHQTTDSLYAEATIPLVTSENAVPGVAGLELQVADRYERYFVTSGTTSEYVIPGAAAYGFGGPFIVYTPCANVCNAPVAGGTTSYGSNNETFGLKYKPMQDVILRASLATAFLPPTFSQLLADPAVVPDGDYVYDPKTNTSYPVNTIGGGNPNLKPEHDRSWNVGVIVQPGEGVLSGLRIDAEYYQITQFDAIGMISGNQILEDPALSASRVTRNSEGIITLINESLINAPEYKTEGFDYSVDYRKPTIAGAFELRAQLTFIDHEYRQYSVGAPLWDLAGWPDDGGETKTKANATLSWDRSPWQLAWTARYFDGYGVQGAPGDPTGISTFYTQAQGSYRIPSQIYHDMVATYVIRSPADRKRPTLTLQAGVKNVFNTLPPFDAASAPFRYSQYGDLRLRDYRLSVRASF